MRASLRAGLGLALTLTVAAAGWGASASAADDKASEKDGGKRETVHGVIAGVTVEGETAIDYATQRAQTVEASFLTIIGSPVRDKGNTKDDSKDKTAATGGRHRHNVYVIWLTPQTKLCDATAAAKTDGKSPAEKVATTLDKVEVGDHVEVTFDRHELSRSGGNDADAAKARRHGRHRTYFGKALDLTILSEPAHAHDAATRNDQGKGRDDDADKTRDKNR